MYSLNEIFYEDEKYAERAAYCNENDLVIVEIEPDKKGRRFQIQAIPEPTDEEKATSFRYRRVKLLNAFDKWEKAVLRGREDDDTSVMEWYQSLLDLQESAFNTIPDRVKYYL